MAKLRPTLAHVHAHIPSSPVVAATLSIRISHSLGFHTAFILGSSLIRLPGLFEQLSSAESIRYLDILLEIIRVFVFMAFIEDVPGSSATSKDCPLQPEEREEQTEVL